MRASRESFKRGWGSMRKSYLRLSAKWALQKGRNDEAESKIAKATQDAARTALEQVRSLDNNFPNQNKAARDSWGLYINRNDHPW